MKRWRRRKAQEVRKRHPHSSCRLCGGQALKTVVDTDWDFTGWIVKKRCYQCKAIVFAGPIDAIKHQVSVQFTESYAAGLVYIGFLRCQKLK